jgi:hypothetical protein
MAAPAVPDPTSPAGATVIAFAARPARDAAARLRAALAELDRALLEQREAVTQWGAALSALRGSVGGLGGAMRRYQDRLDGLQDDTAALNAQALRLSAWADTGTGSARPE